MELKMWRKINQESEKLYLNCINKKRRVCPLCRDYIVLPGTNFGLFFGLFPNIFPNT